MASVGYQAGNYGQGNQGGAPMTQGAPISQGAEYNPGNNNQGFSSQGANFQAQGMPPQQGNNFQAQGMPPQSNFQGQGVQPQPYNQGTNFQGQGMPPHNNQQQNVQVINSIQIQQNHPEGTKIGWCLAITILIINIFLPGIGTMIGSCVIRDPIISASICCAGVCQLLTAPCIIGWCFAQCYSCYFVSVASTGESLESLYVQKHPNVKHSS